MLHRTLLLTVLGLATVTSGCARAPSPKPIALPSPSVVVTPDAPATSESAVAAPPSENAPVPQASWTLRDPEPPFARLVERAPSTVSEKYIFLTNNGTATGSLTTATLDPAGSPDFKLIENSCTGVYPGSSCYILVQFTASQEGLQQSSLFLPTGNYALEGVGLFDGWALVSSEKGFFNFVVTMENTQSTPLLAATLKRENQPGPLKLPTLGGTNPKAFQLRAPACGQAAEGETCELSVVFTPLTVGPSQATLQLLGKTLEFRGEGQPAGPRWTALNPEAAADAFPDTIVGSISKPIMLSFENSGQKTGSLQELQFSGTDAQDFAVKQNTCSLVPPKSSCYALVSFSPKISGSKTAKLTIGPTTFELKGNSI
jgi:hypothetical protein